MLGETSGDGCKKGYTKGDMEVVKRGGNKTCDKSLGTVGGNVTDGYVWGIVKKQKRSTVVEGGNRGKGVSEAREQWGQHKKRVVGKQDSMDVESKSPKERIGVVICRMGGSEQKKN